MVQLMNAGSHCDGGLLNFKSTCHAAEIHGMRVFGATLTLAHMEGVVVCARVPDHWKLLRISWDLILDLQFHSQDLFTSRDTIHQIETLRNVSTCHWTLHFD